MGGHIQYFNVVKARATPSSPASNTDNNNINLLSSTPFINFSISASFALHMGIK